MKLTNSYSRISNSEKPIKTIEGGNDVYRLNGKLHREDGPAVYHPQYESYYLNDKKYPNKESHQKAVFNSYLKKALPIIKSLGYSFNLKDKNSIYPIMDLLEENKFYNIDYCFKVSELLIHKISNALV